MGDEVAEAFKPHAPPDMVKIALPVEGLACVSARSEYICVGEEAERSVAVVRKVGFALVCRYTPTYVYYDPSGERCVM